MGNESPDHAPPLVRARRVAWIVAGVSVAILVVVAVLLLVSYRSYAACRDWQREYWDSVVEGAATDAPERPGGCPVPTESPE